MLAARVNTGVAGEKINLFKIQSDNIRRVSLQAFISHEIARYLGKYAKARPLCQANRYAPSGVKSAVRYPL